VAILNEVTGLPLGVNLISGSLPRLPMIVILFRLTIDPQLLQTLASVRGKVILLMLINLDQKMTQNILRYSEACF
jgi:hypothetical protein